MGLAVGAASLVVPIYISELSPSNFRGRLVTLSILFITFGQMIAYLIGWKLSTIKHGWRWMVGLGAVPAAVQLGLILLLPETPRWLMKAGRITLARNVLRKVYGIKSEPLVEKVLRAISVEILNEEKVINARRLRSSPTKHKAPWLLALQDGCTELFGVGANRRALTIACLLQGLQQLCGFVSPTAIQRHSLTNLPRTEFPYVLFRYNLFTRRLQFSYASIPLRRSYKLHIHRRGYFPDRPDRPPTYSPFFHPYHGPWIALCSNLLLHAPTGSQKRRNRFSSEYSASNRLASLDPLFHRYLRQQLCSWPGQCSLATVGAFPIVGSLTRIWHCHFDELGQ